MTIKLNETGLTAVVVPEDATDFKIVNGVPFGETHFCSGWNTDVVSICELDDEDFEILGFATKDEISFGVEPYVEKYYAGYKNYLAEGYFLDKNQGFYSLLQSKGIYFVNPMEKPKEPKVKTSGRMADYFTKNIKWQSYESKIAKKVVIINKV